MRHATCVLLAFLGPAGLAHVPGQRNLTFEDRVTAQAAIERVYYGHQLETKVPFARAVPREVLEAKVQRALQQSAALERYWHTSVTDEMLERELARMAQGSRMPERLLELYAALDNDEVLVKECLARATLVDRLTRNFYDSDRELQATKAGWDAWWDEASRSLDPRSVPAVAQAVGGLPVPSAGHPFSGPACASDNTWDNGSLDDLPEGRTAHSAVWTGSVMVVWGGRTNNNAGGYGLNSGGRYDPTTDSWASTSMVGAPAVRSDHVAVWTGTQMLIWGGLGLTTYTDTGARYDPLTDTWTAMSGLNTLPAGQEAR